MSAAQLGGMAGAVLGLLSFAALRFVADRLEQQQGKDREKAARTANMIRMIAIADLLLLTGVGYFVGPLVLGRG